MKTILDAARSLFDALGTTFAAAEKPERDNAERQCVYCNEKFKDSYVIPLTTSEAQSVSCLCPIHLGSQRTYHRKPQDPWLVCDCCILHFRSRIPVCHFTKFDPRTYDPNYKRCSRSMKEAGRSLKLIFDKNGGPSRYEQFEMPRNE
ncbi:Hypothetical predicted protein [Cloeon dipterum]|uniref:Uncharacterized protein n=1 Tax=Cloeon dipterum TaxID=197152 RepID=A0A8S1DU33_9INSE|nr:Hypothetical predicted protein [Cloeon dipterum]